MDVDDPAPAVAAVALAIGEPARARMLSSLLDGHARTGTELAVIGDVSASTASAHAKRLVAAGLVRVVAQGRHRYYRLAGPSVAWALEHLAVVATGARPAFTPTTPTRLRAARRCYDHLAGTLGVALHDRFRALGWLATPHDADEAEGRDRPESYAVAAAGERGFRALGLDLEGARRRRRTFACPCLDWSERRSHLGGALGAAVLDLALDRRWVAGNRHDRALEVTPSGRRILQEKLGVLLPSVSRA